MSAEAPGAAASAARTRRLRRQIAAAAIVALVAAVAYQAIGASIFLPRFASDDAREVVTAYFEAQRWGFEGLSERALDPGVRAERKAPNHVDALINDILFAGDLEVSEGQRGDTTGAWFDGDYAEVQLFTVTYDSPWKTEIGQPPGGRHWFVYAGRNPGAPWLLLGQGTGP